MLKVYSNKELTEMFTKSLYYNDIVKTYYPTAITKAIWWAVKRSKNWAMNRGQYKKL